MPYTPVPNWMIDEVMPLLSDTEWRVLCVIVRSTLGWHGGEPGKRKERDWLTQSQLKARTGRASEAVSRAVDGLVQRGLLEVCAEDGKLLATPQERRHYGGRIAFGVAGYATGAEDPCNDTRKYPGKNGALTLSAPASYAQSEEGNSESELRKANTTKESLNKTEGSTGQPPIGAAGNEIRPNGSRQERPSPPISADAGRFLEVYRAEFKKRSSRGEPPPITLQRDWRLVEALLQQYGYSRLVELLEQFFQNGDPWVKKRGYALFCFPVALPRLLMGEAAPPDTSRRSSFVPIAYPPLQPWQRSGDTVSATSLFERYPDLARRVRGDP